MNKALLSAALAGIFTAGIAASAIAADAPAQVKCYGIAKAGKNDCKAANGAHSCKGQATKDNDVNDFSLIADKAACDKAGGKLNTSEKAKM